MENHRNKRPKPDETPSPEDHGDSISERNNQFITMKNLLECLSNLPPRSVDPKPPIPAPSKFCLGDDYHRWESQVRRYLKRYPATDHAEILLSLIDGTAYDRVFYGNLIKDDVTEETFKVLRWHLDTPGLVVDHRRNFLQRMQLEGEDATTFLTALRRLAVKAFPAKTTFELEATVFDQFLEGITNSRVKEEFVLRPPVNLDAALEVAKTIEDLQTSFQGLACTAATLSTTTNLGSSNNPGPSGITPGTSSTMQYRGRPGRRMPYPRGHFRNSRWNPRQYGVEGKQPSAAINHVTGCSFPMVNVVVGGKPTWGLVDTGASKSLISLDQ